MLLYSNIQINNSNQEFVNINLYEKNPAFYVYLYYIAIDQATTPVQDLEMMGLHVNLQFWLISRQTIPVSTCPFCKKDHSWQEIHGALAVGCLGEEFLCYVCYNQLLRLLLLVQPYT